MVRRLIAGTVVALALTAAASARDVAVVFGKSGTVQSVAMQDLLKICTGKMTKWPDGREIQIFVPDPGSPGMNIVAEKVLNVSGRELRVLLQKVPGVTILTSDQDVLATVPTVPGAIGFVDVYSINGNVLVIKVEGKLPLEPGYVLHKSQ
jgi:ABC-type phosphate transport system substrate-binding protein